MSEARAAKVVQFIEKYLHVPEGSRVGQPVELRDWQKEIIDGIYGRRTRRAIISFARKNGKSALVAMLLLVHLVGPAMRRNSQIYSAAQSRDQAAVVFGLAAKMIRLSPALNELITIRDSKKELYCPRFGVIYRALSADATTAYGLSPVLVLHDELGQVRGPRSELYEALETATAAQADPLSIIISTQAPNDSDLLSELIDDAKKPDAKRVELFLYTSDPEADPFAEDTIRQANPAFGDFQNAEEVLEMAEGARRMPAREAEYRNLVLNQRVEASNPFISPSVWKENGGAPELDWTGRQVYAGLDLSEVNDLTALVLACPIDGTLHVQPTFWLPADGLRERSRKDRVEYDVWAKDGLLMTTPGRSIEYDWVAEYIVGLLEQYDIRFAFDRWNMRHFTPCLVRAGMTEDDIEDRFEGFGQGYQSMSPALRELESMLLNGRIRHGNHPVLTMCAVNSVVTMDPAGNRKLDKRKAHGRIDGMVALAMAASMAAKDIKDPDDAPFVMWA